MKTKLFQVVVNNLATKFVFDLTQKVELVDKMVELQKGTHDVVTFLKINL